MKLKKKGGARPEVKSFRSAHGRKAAKARKITAFGASKMISYGGRFRAFGAYVAFPAEVLKGIRFYSLRQKASAKAKLHKMKEVA